MKKYNLLKFLGLTVILVVLLTWLVPYSTVSDSKITLETINPAGLWNLVSNLSLTFNYFGSYGFFIMILAAFYAVAKKTGQYEKIVTSLQKFFKGNERNFVIISILTFGILSAVFGLSIAVFIFIPVFWSVILALGYDKITALMATVGASIVGSIGALYSVDNDSILKLGGGNTFLFKLIVIIIFATVVSALLIAFAKKNNVKLPFLKKIGQVLKGLGNKDKILIIIPVFVVSILLGSFTGMISSLVVGIVSAVVILLSVIALLGLGYNILTVILTVAIPSLMGIGMMLLNADFGKFSWTMNDNFIFKVILMVGSLALLTYYTLMFAKQEKPLKIEMEKTPSSRKKPLGLIIVSAVMAIVAIMGILNWEGFLGVTTFENLTKNLLDVKIGSFPIIESILGNFPAFGTWGINEMIILLAVATLALVIIYRLEVSETIAVVGAGIKKVFPIALTIILINIVVVTTVNSGFYYTLINALISVSNGFNIVTMAIIQFVGSFLQMHMLYLTQINLPFIQQIITDTSTYSLIALVTQTMYGAAMLVAPTSLMLVAGLYYLNISYTSWLKYIWKLFVALMILIFIVLTIATLV